MVLFGNSTCCHFKTRILGFFRAGKSLIQCHTYILVPVTSYSHLHVGRKQNLKNILWSSTHWSARNLSSVLQLRGRRSRNIIYTIFKKKKERKHYFHWIWNYCYINLQYSCILLVVMLLKWHQAILSDLLKLFSFWTRTLGYYLHLDVFLWMVAVKENI